MARYFLDTSALVKRYHLESGSNQVQALFDLPENRLVISRLALVEVHSAFARRVREGTLAEDDFRKLVARLGGDVTSRVLRVVALSSVRLADASMLLSTLGLKCSIRSLDAMHLVTAQTIARRSPVASFVAADKRILEAAHQCGLTCLDVS